MKYRRSIPTIYAALQGKHPNTLNRRDMRTINATLKSAQGRAAIAEYARRQAAEADSEGEGAA